MTEFFGSLALRIFTGGIICCAAMLVAGDGAKKEVVRLCCACVMVIFVLSPLKGASFSISGLTSDAKDAEARINSAVSESRSLERNSVAVAIAGYVEEQAKALGIECEAHVDYTSDEKNVLHVTAITIVCQPAESAVIEELKQIIARDCGVGRSQITVLEANRNEN